MDYSHKRKTRIQKFKETGDLWYIYRDELDKACIHNDMAYGDFKDLPWRTAPDKVFLDKAFKIINPKYDGYQCGFALMVCICFYKKAGDTSTHTGRGMPENQQLTNELHRSIIRKFHRCNVYSFYQDIYGADLTDVQLITKYNNRVRFLLCVIDIYGK